MKYLILLVVTVVSLNSFSQSNIYVNNHVISSDFALSSLIDKHKQKNEHTDEIKGYRIQIISDNNRARVYEEKAKVYQQFSEFKTYLKYVQPYYKLRIGDFKTRLEARNYLEKVIRSFPSAFVVFDDIKVR